MKAQLKIDLRTTLAPVIVSLLLLNASTNAFAQSAAAEDANPASDIELEEIIVTAQKRAERAQDVPISIAAVSGERLERAGIVNPLDLAREIPNLKINPHFGSSAPLIFMRGIGINNFNPTSAGAIGVAIDEVFLNSPIGQLVNIYDLDRIEVLKGPQGTLYGRNTTGGVINFYTRKPTFEFDPRVQLSYGRYNELVFEAASSFPIITDRLAGRLAVNYRNRDGWRRDLTFGGTIEKIDNLSLRGQLLFVPSDRLEISLKQEVGLSRGDSTSNVAAGIIDPATGTRCSADRIRALGQCSDFFGYISPSDPSLSEPSIEDPSETLDSYATRIGVNWEGEAVTVDSVSAYVSNKQVTRWDIDASPSRILEMPELYNKAVQWSQELRLSSNSGGRFDWIVGGFFLTEKVTHANTFEVFASANPTPGLPFLRFFPPPPVFRVRRDFTQNTDSYAVFAQADYSLTDKLTATVGGRYTWEEKDINLFSRFGPVTPQYEPTQLQNGICCLVGDPASADPVTGLPTRPIVDKINFKEPIWRLALSYKPSENMLLYASYNRGVRASGFNAQAITSPSEYSIVRPEKIDAFEVGMKSDLLDRRLRFNAAAFYYTGELQVFTFQATGGGVPVLILDSASIESYGLETDIRAKLLPGLEMALSAGYLHGEYTNYPGQQANVGNKLASAPEISLAASLHYETDIGADWSISADGDISYQSKIFFEPNNNDVQRQSGYAIVNGRIGFKNSGHGIELFAYGKNLTNEIYVANSIDLADFGFYEQIYGLPRTYGVGVSFNF